MFDVCIDFRKNIPHVVYFEMIEYLVQTLEVKLEFSHILMISKFVSQIGSMVDKNLTWMHFIFEQDEHNQEEADIVQILEEKENMMARAGKNRGSKEGVGKK